MKRAFVACFVGGRSGPGRMGIYVTVTWLEKTWPIMYGILSTDFFTFAEGAGPLVSLGYFDVAPCGPVRLFVATISAIHAFRSVSVSDWWFWLFHIEVFTCTWRDKKESNNLPYPIDRLILPLSLGTLSKTNRYCSKQQGIGMGLADDNFTSLSLSRRGVARFSTVAPCFRLFSLAEDRR